MLHLRDTDGITEVALARTLFGRPMRIASAFLIDGLLVDCGPPAVERELMQWAARASIEQLFVTHHHEDHAGNAAALARVLGERARTTPATVPLVAAPAPIHLYRRVIWGSPTPATLMPVEGTLATAHHRFAILPTPGHSFDHACLHEPERAWVFTGDLYIHERVRYLRADEDLVALARSLRRVAALSPRLLACAHAGFVAEPVRAIERKLGFWRELAIRAQRLAKEGLSAAAVSRRVLGREGLLTYVTAGHFSKVNLARALLAIDCDELTLS